MKNYKIIKTEKEYNEALNRLEIIFDAKSSTPTGEEAELLALLIEEYEEQHYKIASPDPIEAIRIRMEEMQLRQKDLIGLVGTKSIVSEVLNRKRRLTVKMIRGLSERLKITAEVLIQEYKLEV